MTPTGLKNISTHPPPPQLPLPSDEGVPRTDTLTPPATRDEGVADPQPPIPKPPIESYVSCEPSTQLEGVNEPKDNPATSCLEGVTNLNLSKQDSVDEAITKCTVESVVDLLSDSGGLAYAAKLLGPHQHPLRWDATRHRRPTNANNATTTPTPHVTSSLRLRGSGTKKGKKTATRTPTRGTFDTADDDDETPDDSSTLHPDIEVVGSSSDLASTISPSLPAHAPVPTTPLDPSAGTREPSPTATDLEDLRTATDANRAAPCDLHLLSDEFRQFRSDQRARDQAHQDATTRLTLQFESNSRAQSVKDDGHDASLAELSSSLRLFTETQEAKIDEMKTLFSNALLKIQGVASGDRDELAQHPPTPDALRSTPPLAGAPGADRFTHLPFGRGRPLRGSPQPHPRLTRPEAAGLSSYARNRGSPHQRDSLGESPPNPHDKRNAAYCRAIDIARVQDFKRYAILIVVDIDETATAFVSEQFRIWTLSRPQTTSVTIETAVWSLFRISLHEAQIAFTDLKVKLCDFANRLQHGEDTEDSLDGILRVTLPHTPGLDAPTTVKGVLEALVGMDIDENVRTVITSHVPSCAAVKATMSAHLAPLPSPTRTRERNDIRRTLMIALMTCPYSEEPVSTHYGDHITETLSSSSEPSRRTLWNRLPQLDVAGALPSWTPGLSIQDFQQLLLTTLHSDTTSLIADLLRETDPLQTILAAILRRHHDSAEFTTIVTADVAEHLKSELGYYKEHNANTVVEAQRNPADPRLQRSFLSVLCACLAAIRSAFLGTSRDGALHSEARQFLTQLATMRHRSDVHYLLEANSYWLRYTKLWGPVLLLNLCDGGQLQTLLPSITARLTPDMQERILLFFGDIAHRLRAARDAGTLPKAFALQLSSILGKPLLLHSTIPSLSIYAEFSDQVEDLSNLHRREMTRGIHTHRIAHPADLAFVGKTGALADWWPAMIRHVLGHHKRILVAPPDQIAHVAWDDIQPLTYHDYATTAQSLHQLGDVL